MSFLNERNVLKLYSTDGMKGLDLSSLQSVERLLLISACSESALLTVSKAHFK